MRKIYLDYAAATPLDPQVLKVMGPYLEENFYNPSASYLAAKQVRAALEEAREKIAVLMGSRPSEIIFTAGATEANNLAIQGVIQDFADGEIVVGATEHESVLAPAGLYRVKYAPVDSAGIIRIPELTELISDKAVLVSVMAVNNETGTIQPLKEIAGLIKDVRKEREAAGSDRPLYLHTDAAQAPNYLDLHGLRLAVDMMSVNGGKVYGPKQTGCLFIRTGVKCKPLILGGGQERNLRAGTENVAGAVGLAKALEISQERRAAELIRVSKLAHLFKHRILQGMPLAVLNRPAKHCAPHIASVSFPGFDNERLMMELDELGVQAAVGSACSASSDEPSHVLTAMGLNREMIRSTLRFSFGRQTTEADIRRTVGHLLELTS